MTRPRTRKSASAAVVSIAALALGAGGAVTAEGATPAEAPTLITSCPKVLHDPGEYVVANDMTCNPRASLHQGITFGFHARDITLDLNGKTITAPPAWGDRAYGVVNSARGGNQRNIRVIGNGALLEGWTWGVGLDGIPNVEVTGVNVGPTSGIASGKAWIPSGAVGIEISRSRGVVVTGNTITDDDGDSLGISLLNVRNGTVEGNTIVGSSVGVDVNRSGSTSIVGNAFGDGTTATSPLDNVCDLSVDQPSDVTLTANLPGDGPPALTTC